MKAQSSDEEGEEKTEEEKQQELVSLGGGYVVGQNDFNLLRFSISILANPNSADFCISEIDVSSPSCLQTDFQPYCPQSSNHHWYNLCPHPPHPSDFSSQVLVLLLSLLSLLLFVNCV